MRLKHLESALSSIPNRSFVQPKIILEQYVTSPHLTASILLLALEHGDIGPGRSVLDLGCGTGMLTIGSALLGCDYIMALDCDVDALELAKANVNSMIEEEEEEETKVEFVLAQVRHHVAVKDMGSGGGDMAGHSHRSKKGGRGNRNKSGRRKTPAKHAKQQYSNNDDDSNNQGEHDNVENISNISLSSSSFISQSTDGLPLLSNCIDTVLTNPPFGTKHNAGMDLSFLKASLRLARKTVYSFHKSSTRSFLIKTISNDWGFHNVKVVATMKFDIPQMYKFHKEKSVDVDVDLIRISLENNDNDDDDDQGDE